MNIKTTYNILIVNNNVLSIRNTDDLLLDYKKYSKQFSVRKGYKDNFVFINEIKRNK